MTGQRILLTGLWIAIIGTVVGSGDAEARNRCGRGNGRCNNGYAFNSGRNSNYNQNACGTCQTGFTSGCNQSGCNQSGCTSGCNVNPAVTGTMNGTVNGNVQNQQWNGAPQQYNGTTQQWNAATQQWVTTPANQGVIQTNGTYSAGKPITNDAAAPQPVTAPAPANNNFGNSNLNNRAGDAVQQNTSPDADNEGRGASKVQGTAPSKAPLPAATTNP